MYFISAELVSLNREKKPEEKESSSIAVQCWIKGNNEDEVIIKANEDLAFKGWKIIEIKEIFPTSEDDYFPPCNGLDSYRKAEISGTFYRFPKEISCEIISQP